MTLINSSQPRQASLATILVTLLVVVVTIVVVIIVVVEIGGSFTT
jgi:hypothetical protein